MEPQFKIEPSEIPEIDLRILCAAFLDATQTFYKEKTNVSGFEQWLSKGKGGMANGQENGGQASAGLSDPFAG